MNHDEKTLNKVEKTLAKDIRALLIGLKPEIHDDYRADEGDEKPGMLVTIGARLDDEGEISWNYQTGDNSFTGGAYGYAYWCTLYLYRRSNCTSLAKDAASELLDEIARK